MSKVVVWAVLAGRFVRALPGALVEAIRDTRGMTADEIRRYGDAEMTLAKARLADILRRAESRR